MTRIVYLFFYLFVFVSASVSADPLDDSRSVKVYTLLAPPMVTADARKPGYAFEIVTAMFQEAGLTPEIRRLPWRRSQMLLQQTKEGLIFPFTRTPSRESDYGWAVKIYSSSTHFVTLNDEKMTPKLAFHKTVGVHSGTSWDNWLDENGYKNVRKSPNGNDMLLNMLHKGRIDAWYTEATIAQNSLANYPFLKATLSEPVETFDVYLASHRSMPSPHVERLQQALTTLIKDGRYAKILEKYGMTGKLTAP
ncbi:transporter substrate-binding domain-containing protein [Temperatibacter marinus]|uniref:Transporter substrate-binding domain-containing protein n=1 Tax=Temperatibacter marinus TaxID=1456591 RepID=A0AA52EFF5_9PROT|nr:transporter substrate-binding domain-containing protein [Temperatibacter marinus]WND01542.1 transporter substrate-binding domain-containing protein [Temperatibacter marinus]